MYESMRDEGQQTPLDDRPELDEDEAVFWAAFCSLNQVRPDYGCGPCRIPMSEISAWLGLAGISDQEDVSEYVKMITGLDSDWLKWADAEYKAKVEAARAAPRKR